VEGITWTGTQLRLAPIRFLNDLILGDLKIQFLALFIAATIKAGTMGFQVQPLWDLSQPTMDPMEPLIKLVMSVSGHWTGTRQPTMQTLMGTDWFGVDPGEPSPLE